MSSETLVEHALVAALVAALPGVVPYPAVAPEGVAFPFIVYRQMDSSSDEGYSVVTHTATFEIDSAKVKALTPEGYQESKSMAQQIFNALYAGFESTGVCVYGVKRDKLQDQVDISGELHWCRSTYTFTYDTPIQ